MLGKVEEYLLDRIRKNMTIHITLIDPEEVTCESASFLARESEICGSSAIMVGGTTLVSSEHLDKVVVTIKNIAKIPVILFPNNVTGISKYADAIWFMSLLNSTDPYFISGAQVLAAPLIKKFNLEAIPLGYIIVGDGGSAGVIGKACPIPYNKPELAAAHALAAKYMGMRFVYLEGGSGANQPVPRDMIGMVKEMVDIPLIVGGGIRNEFQAKEIASAGAEIIVTSTAIEESEIRCVKSKIEEIMKGIKEGVNSRITG
jgi:phosphoglycerol geranylgeranyltransferase